MKESIGEKETSYKDSLQFYEQEGKKNTVGIIPVTNKPFDLEFPWHDCFMPINKNFLAIERAMLECFYARCRAIYIVCQNNMQGILRKKLGEKLCYKNEAEKHEKRKPSIPIFYIPEKLQDKGVRDSLTWGLFHAFSLINRMTTSVSKHHRVEQVYVAFPYGVYQYKMHHLVWNKLNNGKQFFYRNNGKTVMDGEYLGFCLSAEDIKKLKKVFLSKAVGSYITVSDNDENYSKILGGNKLRQLYGSDKYTGRFLTFKDIFEGFELSENVHFEDVEYSDISSWEKYVEYMRSPLVEKIKHTRKDPGPIFLPKWNGVAVDWVEKVKEQENIVEENLEKTDSKYGNLDFTDEEFNEMMRRIE